ncbi:MAG TPA: hypothetical protein PKK06_09475 [Phycisphaerae bacterium]|nr:hypothetical protein [Phycisphaerae bacterium]HNU45529.1 hypothetical protein [Phycisphaerae bacterium]
MIGELARHESARGFVWIKYLVEALLPDLGFRGAEAQTTLDRMKDSQVIILAKVPNPKRPEFPVTEVRLNRSHPLVEQVLAQGKAPTARFPLGTVRGEPLSHTILRERR